jgi:hypothetical protein
MATAFLMRPFASNGEWRLWLSSKRYAAADPVMWGGAEDDIPVPADYDGDKRADLAYFRPSTGTWHVLLSSGGNPDRYEIVWGESTDRPMAFDYDNDGRADLVMTRSGELEILLSSTNYTSSVKAK